MLEAVDQGVLKEFFVKLEELQAAVEILRENQEEIIEKLDNMSNPAMWEDRE